MVRRELVERKGRVPSWRYWSEFGLFPMDHIGAIDQEVRRLKSLPGLQHVQPKRKVVD